MECRVLLVSRDEALQLTRALLMKSWGYTPICVSSPEEAWLAVHIKPPLIVLLCNTLSEQTQQRLARELHDAELRVICFGAIAGVDPRRLLALCERLAAESAPTITYVDGLTIS